MQAAETLQSFSPELYDLLVPDDEMKTGKLKNIFILMQVSETDLKTLIELGPRSGMSHEHIKIILYNTLCALKFMHSCNVVHRDLKPANILINNSCQVMICDYGLARTLPESCLGKGSGNTKRVRDSIIKQQLKDDCSTDKLKKIISSKLINQKKEATGKVRRCLSSHIGSRWYRAPEISILENKYDSASDIWSFGCCVYELIKVLSLQNRGHIVDDNGVPNYILFPGDSCYPLSPLNSNKPLEHVNFNNNNND